MKLNSRIQYLVRKLFSGKISKGELNDLNDWYYSKFTEEEVFVDSYETKEQVKSRMLNRLKNEIQVEENRSEISLIRFRQIGGMVAFIAAMIFIAITVFININQKPENSDQTESRFNYLERSNPNGQKSKIILSDGTTVWLNAASKIAFPEKFKTDERTVFLEGEAFFDVIRDETSPFIIKTETTTTTVLGTSFNIKSYNSEAVKITVESGEVKVSTVNNNSKSGEAFLIVKNEQVTVDSKSGEIQKKKVNAKNFFSWKEDVIRFDNTKLSEVVKTLERWYDKKITVENEQLNDCVLVAEYKNERLYNVLQSLKFSLGIDFEVLEDEIIISGNGCK